MLKCLNLYNTNDIEWWEERIMKKVLFCLMALFFVCFSLAGASALEIWTSPEDFPYLDLSIPYFKGYLVSGTQTDGIYTGTVYITVPGGFNASVGAGYFTQNYAEKEEQWTKWYDSDSGPYVGWEMEGTQISQGYYRFEIPEGGHLGWILFRFSEPDRDVVVDIHVSRVVYALSEVRIETKDLSVGYSKFLDNGYEYIRFSKDDYVLSIDYVNGALRQYDIRFFSTSKYSEVGAVYNKEHQLTEITANDGDHHYSYVLAEEIWYDEDGQPLNDAPADFDMTELMEKLTTVGLNTGVSASGWVQNENGWTYRLSSGATAVGWQKIDGKWYFFNGYGTMQTGWQKDGDAWYYFGRDGAMATGWLFEGEWYYFAGNGAMATGWKEIGGAWYYFNDSGAMATGWLQKGSLWYYLNPSGEMATGTIVIGGKTYVFDASGAWIE